MAIALVGHTSFLGPNGFFDLDVGDNTGANMLIVAISQYSGGPTGDPVDNFGNTYFPLITETTGASYAMAWYAKDAIVGPGQLLTLNLDGSYLDLDFYALSGVQQAAPPQVGNTGGADHTMGPGSTTPASDGAFIVTVLSSDAADGLTWSIDGGFTIDSNNAQNNGVNIGGACAHLLQDTAAAVNPTWTYGAGDVASWAAKSIVLLAEGSEPPATTGMFFSG